MTTPALPVRPHPRYVTWGFRAGAPVTLFASALLTPSQLEGWLTRVILLVAVIAGASTGASARHGYYRELARRKNELAKCGKHPSVIYVGPALPTYPRLAEPWLVAMWLGILAPISFWIIQTGLSSLVVRFGAGDGAGMVPYVRFLDITTIAAALSFILGDVRTQVCSPAA